MATRMLATWATDGGRAGGLSFGGQHGAVLVAAAAAGEESQGKRPR